MTSPRATDTALELDFRALYFRCRGLLNLGALYFCGRRVLSKAQLAGVQNPDPLVQTGLRITSLVTTLIVNRFGKHNYAQSEYIKYAQGECVKYAQSEYINYA